MDSSTGFEAFSNHLNYMLCVASIASITFFLTVIIGNIIGTILPIVAKRFGIDGAVFSGPVQTTILDIISIVIYFLLTTILLIIVPSS